MMSRNLLLVAVTGALTGWLPQAAAQQKHVVLSNVDGVAGQAQVAGKAAIPLTGNAQVDAQGNIVVTCQKGTPAGVGVNDCSNVGTGSTGALTSPGITFNGPSAVVAATETTARLHWTTSNAHACYGVAPVLSGWNKEWATNTTGSTGFQVGNLTRHATDQTSYTFTLRCYSNVDATVGNTDVVAYTDTSHTVTLAPSSGGGGTAGSCDSYLEGLGEIGTPERDHFEAYRAENRGFSPVHMTFQQKTTRILGEYEGKLGPNTYPVIPGMLGQTQYLALSFTLPTPTTGAANTSKFRLKTAQAIGSVTASDVIITISPCPGDFRPRNGATGAEHYTSNYCRTTWDLYGKTVSAAVVGAAGAGPDWCQIPAGQTMYMNVTKHNLNIAPGTPIPNVNCGSNVHCGAGGELSN